MPNSHLMNFVFASSSDNCAVYSLCKRRQRAQKSNFKVHLLAVMVKCWAVWLPFAEYKVISKMHVATVVWGHFERQTTKLNSRYTPEQLEEVFIWKLIFWSFTLNLQFCWSRAKSSKCCHQNANFLCHFYKVTAGSNKELRRAPPVPLKGKRAVNWFVKRTETHSPLLIPRWEGLGKWQLFFHFP